MGYASLMEAKRKVLVTGASGRLGRKIVQALVGRLGARSVIAGTRTPHTWGGPELGGPSVRHVDFDAPATFRDALDGVEIVLVVPTAEPEERRRAQHQAFLDVAVASVPVVAYAGLLGADAPGPSPLLATHAAAEERLARASRALVFRNGVYLDALPMLLGPALVSGVITHPAGDGAVSWITRDDLAEAIAARIAMPVKTSETIELTGDEALGFAEIATLASAGRPLRYEPATRESYRASLAAAGMSAHGIAAFVDVCDGIAGGSFARVSPAATALVGRRPTSVRAFFEGRDLSTPQAGGPRRG